MANHSAFSIAASMVATTALALSTAGSAQTSIPPDVSALAAGYAGIARDVMDNDLADFPSARVRNVRATYSVRIDGGKARLTFCGEINAKNQAGGFAGWRHFALLPGDDKIVSVAGSKVIIEGDGAWGEAVERFCNNGKQNWLSADFTNNFTPNER